MKLLFDENVSPKLVAALASEYTGSVHVRDVGLLGSDDQHVWDYARLQNFVIVSKDTDFSQRSYVDGHPPKIIWLDVGNSGTAAIISLLRHEQSRLERFDADTEASLLILSIGLGAV